MMSNSSSGNSKTERLSQNLRRDPLAPNNGEARNEGARAEIVCPISPLILVPPLLGARGSLLRF